MLCSKRGALRPHLVVAPLSTLPNWDREFAAWAPQLNVVVLHGNQAARDIIKKHELYSPAQKGAPDQVQRLPAFFAQTHESLIAGSRTCMNNGANKQELKTWLHLMAM